MASESIGSIYPTQIPGYDDAADIQAALRLYHYGSTAAPTNESQLAPNSIAGHIKSIDDRVDSLEEIGVGSTFTPNMPTSVPDGFIWVDSDSVIPIVTNPVWQRLFEGGLAGEETISASGLNGEKVFIVLKDWSHSNTSSEVGLVLRFNGDAGPNYVNTGGLISASALYSPEFNNTATHDLTIKIDLANTVSLLKPVETIADTSAGSYFGYYKSPNKISSLTISLSDSGQFDAGSYEVWSYQ